MGGFGRRKDDRPGLNGTPFLFIREMTTFIVRCTLYVVRCTLSSHHHVMHGFLPA